MMLDSYDNVTNTWQHVRQDMVEEAASQGHTLLTGKLDQPESPRSVILDEAKRITTKDRNQIAGEPQDNFQRIADLWNTYLSNRRVGRDAPIEGWETAIMMVLMKVARIQNSPDHYDHFLDMVGYSATAWEAYTKGRANVSV